VKVIVHGVAVGSGVPGVALAAVVLVATTVLVDVPATVVLVRVEVGWPVFVGAGAVAVRVAVDDGPAVAVGPAAHGLMVTLYDSHPIPPLCSKTITTALCPAGKVNEYTLSGPPRAPSPR